ncbi:translation initiation factor IF-2 [Cryptococcus depauperatus]|nr:translation initiation factor IF-2 [Cryptococcus depauperatus CBS 7855]
MFSATCRYCRGHLYRLPIDSGRNFTVGNISLIDGSEGFKLPSTDWSRPAPQEDFSRNNKSGKRRERGHYRRRNENGSTAEREPNRGFGLKSKSKQQDQQVGNQERRGAFSGLSKWDIGQRSKDNINQGGHPFADAIPHSRDSLSQWTNSAARKEKTPGFSNSAADVESPIALENEDNYELLKKHRTGKDRKGRHESRSLLTGLRDQSKISSLPSQKHHRRDQSYEVGQSRKPKMSKPKVVEAKAEKEVYIPRHISTGNLAKIFGVKLFSLQSKMLRLDMSEDQRRSDYILNAEEACNIALEYDFNPVVDDEASFDIYPDSDPTGLSDQPLRPPVVTIMGHVDHGKTTLLDSLRQTSVAASEAGGITQHIGAFSVDLSSLLASDNSSSSTSTITFLDTPGHAAFTAMRARGASVTDIVVLVVAADDGVMPQTREVLDLVKSEGDKVGLVVAINKCDKPGVDIHKVKSALGAEGIFLEEDGGDVPSVKVSGLRKTGLDNLVETLSTLAEIRYLRARQTGKAEGFVLESRVDKGRGNVATVLVTKGILRAGSIVVAGHTWCRVRQMQNDKGKAIREALPGTPVSITGWKDLPKAGDELLEAKNGENEAKKAVNNRKRDEQRKRLLDDVEQINVKRREERLRLEAEAEAEKATKDELKSEPKPKTEKDDFKLLRLIIKSDVSGTVEAVVGSLEHIGNKEAGVSIISTGVGEVTESDISFAEASDATVIGFNVSAARSVQTAAKDADVKVLLETVIYRLIDKVRADVAALLPPAIEYSVKGEASVLQLFTINLRRNNTTTIAGCRVNNGVIDRTAGVRILRGPDRKVIYEGSIETLKHLKKDVTEVRKGMECGIALENFTDIKEGDEVVTFMKMEVPREL